MALLLATACGNEGPSGPLVHDAGEPLGVDDGGALADADVGRCPELEPLCHTGGYAHFVVSNVEGSGLPNEASYDVTDDIVSDRVTGLHWQRSSGPEPLGWDEATRYCSELELGGRDDFRLPGRIELVTVLDFDQLPVVASVFDAASDYHFTASPASFVEGSAYSVYFGAGETTIARANPGRARVLCVASAITLVPEPRFQEQGEQTVDQGTALAWETWAAPAATFEAATARCAGLDMRLPSIRELQSIVDERRHAPAIALDVFPDAPSDKHWSSTPQNGWPWTVDFTDGTTYADVDPGEALPSRCVR